MEHLVRELNCAAARLARTEADYFTARDPAKPRFVVGSIGPTNRTASLSPDVNRPDYRNVSFADLRETYAEAAVGLIEGGSDILMVETVFDTLNCKAALIAIDDVFTELGCRLPVMISGTITDASGRTLSGQTVAAFWNSVRHAKPVCIGLNCALGATELRPWLQELSKVAECPVSVHPNAGLPNELGGYDDTPEQHGCRDRRVRNRRPDQHGRWLLRYATGTYQGDGRRAQNLQNPHTAGTHRLLPAGRTGASDTHARPEFYQCR